MSVAVVSVESDRVDLATRASDAKHDYRLVEPFLVGAPFLPVRVGRSKNGGNCSSSDMDLPYPKETARALPHGTKTHHPKHALQRQSVHTE